MNLKELRILFGGEELIMNNERAIYWPKNRALILSDLHLGKGAFFRKNGIALPSQVHETDLERLVFLINHYQPTKIIIVGDMVHAGMNSEVVAFSKITKHFAAISFILVRGNHDRISAEMCTLLGLSEVHQLYKLEQLCFSHEPFTTRQPLICGHFHPGVQLQLATKRLKLPCFLENKQQLILPAFSLFSGLDTRPLLPNATYYPFYKDGIFKL